jgi:hypothetical protein
MDRPLYIWTPERNRRPQPPGWGAPMPPIHPTITEILEGEMVAKTLADPHYRNTLLNIKGLFADDALIRTEVGLHLFRKKLPGDVDILIVPNGQPDQSTAIQVKRFKLLVESDDADFTPHLKHMKEVLDKGVQQANDNADLGFSQVYLWIFILIDTRKRNGGKFTYDGPDSRLNSIIRQAISLQYLRPRVGLMTFEWCQPMDGDPFTLGTHGSHGERFAQSVQQPEALTRWLSTLKPGPNYVAPSWRRKSSIILT